MAYNNIRQNQAGSPAGKMVFETICKQENEAYVVEAHEMGLEQSRMVPCV
jgi:hypothetical protein